MVVAGLDLSLSGTGVAWIASDGIVAYRTWSPPAPLRGGERLLWLRTRLLAWLDESPPDRVVLEGYAFGSRNGREALGEWGGIVRVTLTERHIVYGTIPPARAKKVLGNGRLTKAQIVLAVYKAYGVEVTNDNEADAVNLAFIGRDHPELVHWEAFHESH